MRGSLVVGLGVTSALVTSALVGCTLLVDTGDLSDPPDLAAKIARGDAGTSSADARAGDSAVDARSLSSDASAPDASPGLVGDWPFMEGSGTTIGDVSGHGHDGIVFGSGAWVADRSSVAGSAYELKSGGDYVAVGASSDFDRPANASFSMTAWARISEAPDHDLFFSVSYGEKDASFGIELREATLLSYFDGNDHTAEATIPNVIGPWHHYAVVVEGDQARVYFDGVKVGQGTTGTTPREAKQLLFGRSTWGNDLKGALDKARFFRAALNDAEVMLEKDR